MKLAPWIPCLLMCSVYFQGSVDATCTLPSSYWTGKWWDSQFDGDTTLSYSANVLSVTGWSITAYSSTVSSWKCVDEDTTNSYILFKGDQDVDLFSSPQNAYLCMHWIKVTDYSYYYYFRANEEANANKARVYIEDKGTATGAVSKYCNPTSGPSSTDYNMFVKQDIDVSAIAQYFPTPFLGKFYYTANDGTTDFCGTNSTWDVCTDRKVMTFDFTQCSKTMAFTKNGLVYGMYSMQSGSNYYVSVINNDTTVDSSTYYRFTCFVVAESGSNVVTSFAHGSCSSSYSPTTVPTNGLKATLTATVTCPFTTDSGGETDSDGGSSIGVIVGAVVAVMSILGLVIGVFCICKKMKGKSKISNDIEKKQVPPQGYSWTDTRGYRAPKVPKIKITKKHSSTDILESVSPRDALDINPSGEEKKTLQPLDYKPPLPDDAVETHKPLPPITNT